MKAFDEMSEQEVIDEITALKLKLELIKADMQNDEKYERDYESSIDRLCILDYTLTHYFPKLI